jgi:glucose uptake protein
LLCQGSWANTLKLAGRRPWRFELYYFDFAIGLMAMALICGFTFGNLGFDGFALMDDSVFWYVKSSRERRGRSRDWRG